MYIIPNIKETNKDNSKNIRTQSEKENSSQLEVIPMEKEKYAANKVKPHHKIENIFFIFF